MSEKLTLMLTDHDLLKLRKSNSVQIEGRAYAVPAVVPEAVGIV